MMSSLSNEYRKRKLRQVIKDSCLYNKNFDETFTLMKDQRIKLDLDDFSIYINDNRSVAYIVGNNFEYMLHTLDQEIEYTLKELNGEYD